MELGYLGLSPGKSHNFLEPPFDFLYRGDNNLPQWDKACTMGMQCTWKQGVSPWELSWGWWLSLHYINVEGCLTEAGYIKCSGPSKCSILTHSLAEGRLPSLQCIFFRAKVNSPSLVDGPIFVINRYFKRDHLFWSLWIVKGIYPRLLKSYFKLEK